MQNLVLLSFFLVKKQQYFLFVHSNHIKKHYFFENKMKFIPLSYSVLSCFRKNKLQFFQKKEKSFWIIV